MQRSRPLFMDQICNGGRSSQISNVKEVETYKDENTPTGKTEQEEERGARGRGNQQMCRKIQRERQKNIRKKPKAEGRSEKGEAKREDKSGLTLTNASLLPDIRKSPSGEKSTEFTQSVCCSSAEPMTRYKAPELCVLRIDEEREERIQP